MRSTKKLIADLARVNEWLKERKEGGNFCIESDALLRAFNFAKCEIERRLNGAEEEPKHDVAFGGHVGEKLARMTILAADWERGYKDLDRRNFDLITRIEGLKTDLQSARDANTAQTNNETVLVNYGRQVAELVKQRDGFKAELVKQRDGFKAEIVKLRGQGGASQVKILKLTNELEALRKMMQPKSEEAQVKYRGFETPEDCKARLAELEKAAAEKYDRTRKAYDVGVETLAQLHHASMLYSYAAKQHRTIANLLKQRDEAWNDLNYEKHTETLGRITEFVEGAAPKKYAEVIGWVAEFVQGAAPKKRESESESATLTRLGFKIP